MDRREFIKKAGVGVAAVGVAAACKNVPSQENFDTEINPEEMMPYRQNGEDNVSLLGYGCMRWPMIKDENGKDIIDQAKVDEMVDYAMEHGVNYYDSAPVYLQGQSEEATAKALSRYPRDSYYIATKCSNQRAEIAGFNEGKAMYENSLKYYNTDHIDYYLLHSLDGVGSLNRRFIENGLLDYFLGEREKGHIRHLGFSFHGNAEGFDSMMALHEKYHWDFVQIQMNYVDWRHARRDANAEYMYNELVKRNIPIAVMEPLLGGQLSNVPSSIAEQMKQREPEKSVASWAFRFVGSHPGVMTTLSGMTYIEHLKDNLSTFLGFKPLTEEEESFLDEMAGIIRNYPLVDCTGCSYCMPCPYGIDIPTIFKHYNTCVNEGTVAQSSEQEKFKQLRRKYLTSYDKAVEYERQANHCIACGQCTNRCPQHIRIPDELSRIDQYVESLKQGVL